MYTHHLGILGLSLPPTHLGNHTLTQLRPDTHYPLPSLPSPPPHLYPAMRIVATHVQATHSGWLTRSCCAAELALPHASTSRQAECAVQPTLSPTMVHLVRVCTFARNNIMIDLSIQPFVMFGIMMRASSAASTPSSKGSGWDGDSCGGDDGQASAAMTGGLLLCCSRASASPTVKPSRMADGRWRRLLEVDVLGLAGGAGGAGGAPCVRVHSSRH